MRSSDKKLCSNLLIAQLLLKNQYSNPILRSNEITVERAPVLTKDIYYDFP